MQKGVGHVSNNDGKSVVLGSVTLKWHHVSV